MKKHLKNLFFYVITAANIGLLGANIWHVIENLTSEDIANDMSVAGCENCSNISCGDSHFFGIMILITFIYFSLRSLKKSHVRAHILALIPIFIYVSFYFLMNYTI